MALVQVANQQFLTAGTENNWQKNTATDGTGLVLDALPNVTRVTGDGDPYIKIAATAAKPMWWDPNHYEPGIGHLNLFLIGYCAPYGSSVWPNYNTRNGLVELEMRVKDFFLPQEARMIWWFQNTNGSVWFNYGQIANPIDEQLGFGSKGWGRKAAVDGIRDSGWKTVSIPFPNNDRSWLCYGSNPNRTGIPGTAGGPTFYGCAAGGVDEAMDYEIVDMGIHVVYENTLAKNVPPLVARQVRGEMHIRRITLFEDQ